MWKAVRPLFRRVLRKEPVFLTPQYRFFLTESFKLDSAWNERLNSPILKRINVNDLFYELDNQFQRYAFASALDVDLFVNAVVDDSNFDEVEFVVHKLRLSPEAINILPSTQHGLIRLFVKYNKTDDLMRILDDRLNYGIFTDDYCSLLLMDLFIKEGNFRDAAKVSTLGMLQEDISNPLIQYMSLYACHKYLENPVPWNPENNENSANEEDDDDEVVKVRVKYIRLPVFDDHFDLVEPKHLIGKTLTFIGSQIDDHIGRTYKLLGLLHHDKIKQANDYLKSLSESKGNSVLVKDGLKTAIDIVDEKSKSEGKDESSQALLNEVNEHLQRSFPEEKLFVDSNLLTAVEKRLKDFISELETTQMNTQLEIYKEWEKTRENLLAEQIAKIHRDKQLAEIKQQKQYLKEKEEELFFFDNENELDLIIEEKERKKEEQQERLRLKEEAKKPKIPLSQIRKDKDRTIPPLETFYDENIPIKLVKTKL